METEGDAKEDGKLAVPLSVVVAVMLKGTAKEDSEGETVKQSVFH